MPDYYVPNRPADIEAEISTIPPSEGGRESPFFSGYRPNHDFGISEGLTDAIHEYIDSDQILIGESGRARLWFLVHDPKRGKLFEGQEFTVQEGGRKVGHGRITKVMNCDLRKPSI